MTLAEYLRILRRQWWLVLLLAILAVAGSGAYTFTRKPLYIAQTRLFVSVRTGDSASDLSSGSTFTQARVKSYADVVTSEPVLERVITQLGLTYTQDQLAAEVTTDSPLETVLLNESVNDTDAARAADIANALAAAFPQYVNTLETPAGSTASPVRISVTKPATVPASPTSPRVPLNIALGLLIGLGLGFGAAVLRSQLNTTIGGVGDVERATGAVPLGVVPFDRTTATQPLVQPDDKGGRAEAFRTLRTNLQFTDVDSPPRVIVVTSPLPADGKSTTSCNLALTLALSGASVVLIEGDLRKPALGKYLGLSNAAGLTNVLAGQHEARDVLVTFQTDNLALLPSGPTPPNPSELLGSHQMKALIELLIEHFDYVVIDAPPLLPVTDAAVLAASADGAVLVVRHGKTTQENLERARQSLASVNARMLGTVLNFAPAKKRGTAYDGYGYGYGYGAEAAKVPRQRKPAPAYAPDLGRESVLAEPFGDLPTPPRGRRSIDVTQAESKGGSQSEADRGAHSAR